MTNLYFEELEIGTRSAAGPYLVSKDEINQFAKQYDPIPRHIDEQAAARSMFGGLTASGSHCACRKSNSDILVMKSTEKWRRQNATNGMNSAR
jgi:hypothetical protein